MDEADPPIAGMPSPRERGGVRGHNDIILRLETVWNRNALHHAILLVGPRGIGKATLAYQIASMVIANARRVQEAQGTATARQIAQGACQQFRRLARAVTSDGKQKQEISVDDVRALTPFLRQRSGGKSWRVVLVDSADDLNASSANALLKVLEEPGERTLFILIAHSNVGLLDTIKSRCLTLRCSPLADDQLRTVLTGSSLSSSEIEEVVPLARGSVRQAVLLASEGGSDAVQQIDRILTRPRLSTGDVQRLLDLAAGRTQTDLFSIVQTALPTALRSRATTTETLQTAARLADISERISRELAEREEYGIDRGLSLKSAIYDAHRAVWP